MWREDFSVKRIRPLISFYNLEPNSQNGRREVGLNFGSFKLGGKFLNK